MILVGTSGFQYDDWRGAWYPPDIARADMLDFYAGVFPALEINATYYRTPGVRTADSMIQRAAGRLRFAIKAPGEMTHERRLEAAVVAPYREFLEPFRREGLLAAVLLQFPGAFHRSDAARRFLADSRDALEGFPVVAELRHASWDSSEADAEIAAAGCSRAMLDQPVLPGLSGSSRPFGGGAVAYFRFHGRNAAKWWSKDSPESRYRYRYAEEELRPWAPVICEASTRAQATLAFFNNHPDGNAALDAEAMAGILGEPLRGTGYRDMFSAG